MESPQIGYRRIKTVTSALVVLGIAGTLGGSVMAFADTNVSTSANTTPAVQQPTVTSPDQSGSGSTSPGYSYAPAPQLSRGSGSPNAVSSGS